MIKTGSLIEEIKVQLEWSALAVIEKYPRLTIGEAFWALEMLYRQRDLLQQEGWYLLDGYIKEALLQKNKWI